MDAKIFRTCIHVPDVYSQFTLFSPTQHSASKLHFTWNTFSIENIKCIYGCRGLHKLKIRKKNFRISYACVIIQERYPNTSLFTLYKMATFQSWQQLFHITRIVNVLSNPPDDCVTTLTPVKSKEEKYTSTNQSVWNKKVQYKWQIIVTLCLVHIKVSYPPASL